MKRKTSNELNSPMYILAPVENLIFDDLQASKLQINYGEETYNRGKELLAKRKKKGNITDIVCSLSRLNDIWNVVLVSFEVISDMVDPSSQLTPNHMDWLLHNHVYGLPLCPKTNIEAYISDLRAHILQ